MIHTLIVLLGATLVVALYTSRTCRGEVPSPFAKIHGSKRTVGWVERQRNPTLDNRYVDPVLGFTISLFQTVLLKNTAAIAVDRHLL